MVSYYLLAALGDRGLATGFIKPVGQRYAIVDGAPADEDAILMRSALGLPDPLSVMSPVHIPRGFTRAHIRGEVRADLPKTIRRAHARVSEGREAVLIEGTGHAGMSALMNNVGALALLWARLAETERVKLGRGERGLQAFRLVDDHEHLAAACPQLLRDGPIRRHEPGTGIHDEKNDIRFIDREAGLARQRTRNPARARRLESSRIDREKGLLADAALAVIAIARRARRIDHDGSAGAGQPVEQRGFPDVRPPDDDESRCSHCTATANTPPRWVCTTKLVRSSASGAVMIGLPSVAMRPAKDPSSR